MKPVLQVSRLRVDEGGVAQLDGLSFETSGDRVLVLAAPGALFRAAAGVVRPRHGELLSGGLSPQDAVRQGKLAGAPLDPPLPLAWTVHEYVCWSALLSGKPRGEAEASAREALRRLKLETMQKVRLRHTPLAARRAVVAAGALATGARTVFLEDPLRGLAGDAGRNLARVLARATEDVRMVLFAARASLSSPLAMDADEAVVLDGNNVLGQGAPGELAARDRTYAIRLHGEGARFAAAAETRGARVSGEGGRWTIDLGASLGVMDILDVASASDTVVLELRPLAHAFA